jgi:cell division septation protein DedD
LARPIGEDGTGDDAAAAAPLAADEPVAGPRRVRTFAIGPDGKILDTGNAPEPAAPEQQVAAASTLTPIEPVPVPTTSIGGTPAAGGPDPAAAPDLAAAFSPEEGGVAASNDGGNDQVEPPAAAVEPTIEAPATDLEGPSPDIAAAPPVEPAEVPVAEPEPQPEIAAVAPQPEAEPAPAPTAATGEGWSVQISSQRTREEAQSSWSSLSRRFSSVLGSLQPNVQEADLGTKGVYYRLRVGPWTSRSEAINLCESLRSAGGDCIVVR